MSVALYPTLRDLAGSGELDGRELENVVAACAEAYLFPANLDIDSPLSGMAPPSQQTVMHEAIAEGWWPEQLREALDAQRDRKRSH